MAPKKKIVLTGGGTAGHVTPNIALLPGLRNAGFEIYYIGRKSGIEKDLLTHEGIPYMGISSGKLRRYFDWKNFTDIFRIGIGFLQSFWYLLRNRPNVLFSKGGFVSCAPVWAAWLLRIPVIVHESDITPGLANRLSQPFSRRICLTFDETKSHVSRKKAVVTGLPIRAEIKSGEKHIGLEFCQFSEEKPVIMVMGGSQGARKINEVIRNALPQLLENFQVCHLCGKDNLSDIKMTGYFEIEYVREELPDLFAMTDLIISRAGATSIFEILALHLPNVLIPLDAGSRGDQILNAASFEKSGFSNVLPENELTTASLIKSIQETYNKRSEYIENMKNSGIQDSIYNVINVISKVAN